MSNLHENTQIVGILLVKNEEKYIKRVISNVVQFCDKIIVADHESTDRTAEIILEIGTSEIDGKIEYHRISHPRESHNLIKGYAGSKTWIFAVDGDEIYDPGGLFDVRAQILKGHFDRWWMILGNVLNCVELDLENLSARGYLAPPCRSMTKLYNFGTIESWSGPCPERLHGGTVIFKQSFSKKLRREIYKEVSWEEASFRCLHLCFLPRSDQDQIGENGFCNRKNISDINSENVYFKIWQKLINGFGFKTGVSLWKQEKYIRGTLVRKTVAPFF